MEERGFREKPLALVPGCLFCLNTVPGTLGFILPSRSKAEDRRNEIVKRINKPKDESLWSVTKSSQTSPAGQRPLLDRDKITVVAEPWMFILPAELHTTAPLGPTSIP